MVNAFLSYCFKDEEFVRSVHYFLLKQPELQTYFWEHDGQVTDFPKQLGASIAESNAFVLFLGETLGDFQEMESNLALSIKPRILVKRHGVHVPTALMIFSAGLAPVEVDFNEAGAFLCAKRIVHELGLAWVSDDDLPIGYPFAYEKDIIEEFGRGKGQLSAERVAQGCPREWPDVRKDPGDVPNPVGNEEIGAYRAESAGIVVDARTKYQPEVAQLTFPEAGPRQMLRYPMSEHDDILRVGILVSGGIAPGINAVIDGIVRRHNLYEKEEKRRHRGKDYTLEIYGYAEGFKALLQGGKHYRFLHEQLVERQADLGGSMLGTSRADELLDEDARTREKNLRRVIDNLSSHGIRILYVIGGDGSMRAAHAIWKMAKDSGQRISVVGIPKTMDNDILWVWQSFGFLSAVEKAREAILSLYTEVTSNPRLCIIQLFGSDSGFVASHAALASGVCDAVLIPEVRFTMEKLSEYIRERLLKRYNRRDPDEQSIPYGMVVMGETAIPSDAYKYLDDEAVGLSAEEKSAVLSFEDNDRRVRGQTPDALRTAGLKIVSFILQREIRTKLHPHIYWRNFRVFTNEPRHLLRSIPPSVSDVVFGERLGTLAVDNAMAGYTDFMVGQWLTEFVLVPLKLVVLGRKRVPQNGIFWKSVLAKTGQPSDLAGDESRLAKGIANT